MPDNVIYWQVFGNDQQIGFFLQSKDEFEGANIDLDCELENNVDVNFELENQLGNPVNKNVNKL